MNYLKLRIPLILIIFGFSLWLQIVTCINGDVLWLLHVGDKLLSGGKYYYDFIEVNTPMSIYIYLPAVYLSRLFQLSFVTTTIAYLFTLVGASWLFCSYLLSRMFSNSTNYIRYSLEFAITFIYFILPAFNFGEREYLLIVLIMPYLLITACRINHMPVKSLAGYIAGTMAAFGFALKPFFMPLWLSIEIYALLKAKSLKIFCRSECLSCLIVFLLYGASIFLLTPEYITKIIPLILPLYYPLYNYPLAVLLAQYAIHLAFFALVICFLLRKQSINQVLLDLLIISLINAVFIYLVQRTLWTYHMLPIFMIGSILIALLISEFLPKYNLYNAKKLDKRFLKATFISIYLFALAISLISFASNCIKNSFFYRDQIFKNPLYTLAKSAKGQPIYIFTDNILINYPMLDYSQAYSPSHLPSLWIISAAQKIKESDKALTKQAMANKVANFTRSIEIAALIKNRPVYIIVQKYAEQLISKNVNLFTNNYSTKTVPAANHFNYFLQNKQFAQFWQNYKYIGDIDDYTVYKLTAITYIQSKA